MRPTEHGRPVCFVMPSLKAASQAGPERPRSLGGSGRRAGGGPGSATAAAGSPHCTPPSLLRSESESESEREEESESDTRGTRDGRVPTSPMSRVTDAVMSRVTGGGGSCPFGGSSERPERNRAFAFL